MKNFGESIPSINEENKDNEENKEESKLTENQKPEILLEKEDNNAEFDSLTVEDVENYEQPGADEILDIMSEEVSKEEQENIKEMTTKMPLSMKAEIVKIFKEQIGLFKELGNGLGEKIHWNKKKTKAVVCLGLYGLMNVMGGMLSAEEVDAEDGMDLEGDLDINSIQSTLQGPLAELKDDGISTEGYNLFMKSSIELAKEMKGMDEVNSPKIRYSYVVDKMLDWTKSVQEDGSSLEKLQEGLTEITSDYLEHLDGLEDLQEQNNSGDLDSAESDTEAISDEIILPEKGELEFDSHFSEVQKMNIQAYYDSTIEEIHAAAEEFEWWANKYGSKSNFSEFEKEAKEYINNLVDFVENIENNVSNQDFDDKIYVNQIGKDNPQSNAEDNLEALAGKAKIRTSEEASIDAFEKF